MAENGNSTRRERQKDQDDGRRNAAQKDSKDSESKRLRWRPGDPDNPKPETVELLRKLVAVEIGWTTNWRFRVQILLCVIVPVSALAWAGYSGTSSGLNFVGSMMIITGVLLGLRDIKLSLNQFPEQFFTKAVYDETMQRCLDEMEREGESAAKAEALKRDYTYEVTQVVAPKYFPMVIEEYVRQWRSKRAVLDAAVIIAGTILSGLSGFVPQVR